MAQFDIHHNKGSLKETVPFMVLVQSSQFDLYRRRVVVPLVRRSALPRGTPTVGSRMNPVFKLGGIQVVLHPQSVIHSMVEYRDGSMLAQLGNPEMRTQFRNS